MILFHGTGRPFQHFSEEGVGKGGDENSALGVHAICCPEEAGEYARMSVNPDEDPEAGVVLVLRYSYEKDAVIHSNNTFFGIDECGDSEYDHDHFAKMRQAYLNDGVDLVMAEYGEEPVFVLLKPENVKVIGVMSLDQATELGEQLRQSTDDRFDPANLYREYRVLVSKPDREAEPEPT